MNLKLTSLLIATMLLFSIPLKAEEIFSITPVLPKTNFAPGESNIQIGLSVTNQSADDLEDVNVVLLLSHPFSPSQVLSKTLRSDTFEIG
ncbi:MAG: hypothetical protein ACE5HW_00890, partial [Candidatus Methanofastidiosia archaeon]